MVHERKKSLTPGLTPSAPNAAAPPPPQLNLHFDVCAGTFGHYPWDDWERWALARGLDAELAGQGRLLIREAFNHGWEAWLQNFCGWSDDGQALLAFTVCAGIIPHPNSIGRGAFCAPTRAAFSQLSTFNSQLADASHS